jgi:fructose-1,6-bisphosphatase/sedoheptulose 1,7-bisphosphatase-like protein
LDGNDLVARLAVVKVRVLEDSTVAEVELCPNGVGIAQMAAQRADTEAVLAECAVRLLGQEIRGAAQRWQRNAEDAMAGAEAALTEVGRLRRLILAVVAAQSEVAHRTGCPGCASRGVHHRGCPWLALVAEAQKP